VIRLTVAEAGAKTATVQEWSTSSEAASTHVHSTSSHSASSHVATPNPSSANPTVTTSAGSLAHRGRIEGGEDESDKVGEKRSDRERVAVYV